MGKTKGGWDQYPNANRHWRDSFTLGFGDLAQVRIEIYDPGPIAQKASTR